MKFTEAYAKLKEEARKGLQKAAVNVPVANPKAAALAMDLSQRAKTNIASCKDNFRNRRFADAAEDLQQGVEKASKSFGLLTGTLLPKDSEMRSVGHYSYKAFLVHFRDFYPRLHALMEAEAEISKNKLFDNLVMRGVGKILRKAFDAQLQSLPTVDKVEAEITELKDLDAAVMWKATLGLDASNKWVASSLADLQKPAIIRGRLKILAGVCVGVISHLNIFDKETIERVNLADALGRAGLKLFSLSLLTCWHLEPARYPPLDKYWDLAAYNVTSPFVRAIPTFTEHAESAIEHGITASRIVQKLNAGV